jgi:hypothetical protein
MRSGKCGAIVVAAITAGGLLMPIQTVLAKQRSSASGKQLMTARWTASAPQIDGVMSPGEWSRAVPVHVNFVQPSTSPGIIEAGFVPPDNPRDLSYTVYTLYDAFNLYIAVQVADDVLCPGPEVWDGDAVEVFIDGDRVNGCPPPDDPVVDAYGFYPVWTDCTPQGGLNDFLNWDKWADVVYGGGDWSLWRVEGEEGFQLVTDFQGSVWNWWSAEFADLQWASASGLRPRGYVVEWAIALDSIDTEDGPGDVPPGPGDVIGFDIAVDDNDGLGRETQGFWEGKPSGWIFLHEDDWGLLYFEPLPKGLAK